MPEYAHQNDNRPEMGFVSLGDYLGANKGPLDAGYQQDFTQAHALGDTLQSQLGMTEQEARGYAGHGGTAATSAQAPDYATSATSAMQAQEMGRKFGSQSALAGSATDPTNPAASFNAALEYGAHGTDYGTLSGYLGAFGGGGAPDASLAKGNQEGLQDYLNPKPAPEGHDPEQPASNGSPGVFPGTGRRGPAAPLPYTPVGPVPRRAGTPF